MSPSSIVVCAPDSEFEASLSYMPMPYHKKRNKQKVRRDIPSIWIHEVSESYSAWVGYTAPIFHIPAFYMGEKMDSNHLKNKHHIISNWIGLGI